MRLAILLAILVAGSATTPASAAGQSTSAVAAAHAEALDAYAAIRFRKRAREAARSPTPIACTSTGCAPIPPGCRIETGFSQDGMLSGYDAVLCPMR